MREFACGIRNLWLWPEDSLKNPEPKFPFTKNPESMEWNPESKTEATYRIFPHQMPFHNLPYPIQFSVLYDVI